MKAYRQAENDTERPAPAKNVEKHLYSTLAELAHRNHKKSSKI